jgi:hypothetical protein
VTAVEEQHQSEEGSRSQLWEAEIVAAVEDEQLAREGGRWAVRRMAEAGKGTERKDMVDADAAAVGKGSMAVGSADKINVSLGVAAEVAVVSATKV